MLDNKKLQAWLDKVTGVPTAHGDLNSTVYLQQIRDAILSRTPAETRGNLHEIVYLQQIRNAIRGVADGQFGSMSEAVYLQQIINSYNGVADGQFGSLSDNTYLDVIVGVAKPAAVAWYLSGGLTASQVIAVYQPRGAASLAASYINLVNPGVFNAAPGVAPTFNAVTGWTFNGLTQYLTTGITNAKSFVLRFSNSAGGDAFGIRTTDPNWLYAAFTAANADWSCVARIIAAGNHTGGIGILTVSRAYWNGVLDAVGFSPYTAGVDDLYIGSLNNGGGPFAFGALKVQDFAAYNVDLATIAGAPAAISAAVALL